MPMSRYIRLALGHGLPMHEMVSHVMKYGPMHHFRFFWFWSNEDREGWMELWCVMKNCLRQYDIELVRRAVGVDQEPPTVIFPTLRPRAKLSIVDEPGIFERLLGLLGIHERRTGETRVNGRPGKVQAREEGPSVEEPHDF